MALATEQLQHKRVFQFMQTAKKPSPKVTDALRNPNLRLYFAGQIISYVGTWMQQMALSWLVFRLTNSATMLGVIGFATQAPSFLLAPFAGILADRVNRHKLVLVTQILAMVQASILAVVAMSGHVEIWHLVVLGIFMGMITAFDMPSRQTFLVDMLNSREELPQAIAINSSIMTLTRLIGPTVAGLCIAAFGEGACFTINALSYIAVIVALLMIKVKRPERLVAHKAPLEELKEGFSYAFGFRPIRALIVLLALISLFGMPYAVLMPAFAKEFFHGDATTLGWLTAASGVGSLLGAVYLATRKGVLGLGRWVLIGCILFGIGLIGLGLTHNLIVSLAVLVLIGFGGMVQIAASNTLLQTLVHEEKRGRVMSIFTMAFMGTAPFGSMAAGALASHIGLGPTVIGCGCMCLVLAVGFAMKIKQLRREVLPVYVERGIISAETQLKLLNS
jgi:MFS family permease